jgi:two-component system, sensor histidine kinase
MNKEKTTTLRQKMYFQIILLFVLFSLEIAAIVVSINIISAVRAYVGGEGLYSKAQKEAVILLQKYIQTHDEKDYQGFLDNLKVCKGDKVARLELEKDNPDLELVKASFLLGKNHPEDFNGLITLFINFRHFYHINKAIEIWEKGDSLVSRIENTGLEIHHLITSNKGIVIMPDNPLLQNLYQDQKYLSFLEDAFSAVLSEGARFIEGILFWTLIGLNLAAGITLTIIILRLNNGIRKGLNEISRAASKISKGDLSDRVRIIDHDEIGEVAENINTMTDQLIRYNKEMEQFAYITSNDLQEPLRTIINFSDFIREQYQGKLDEEAEQSLTYLSDAAHRMQRLIKELLYYSKIGHENKISEKDTSSIVDNVIADLGALIHENNVKIIKGDLPKVQGHNELKSLFQNLVGNAIHYGNPDHQKVVEVNCISEKGHWLFYVKDNGIGIDKRYHEKIFNIFHRLSNKDQRGAGIGLAHCKKIVELHGGKIWVESEPNKGSTFFFTIPKVQYN